MFLHLSLSLSLLLDGCSGDVYYLYLWKLVLFSLRCSSHYGGSAPSRGGSSHARRDQLLSPGFCASLNQLAISVSIYRSHITEGSSFLLCLLLCQSCMWPAVIPQMDLHALSTLFLPTVLTFLPL